MQPRRAGNDSTTDGVARRSAAGRRLAGYAVRIGVGLSLACGATPPGPGGPSAGGNAVSAGPEREAGEAMALAVSELGALGKVPDRYRIVYVENLLQGLRASPARWRIGFK